MGKFIQTEIKLIESRKWNIIKKPGLSSVRSLRATGELGKMANETKRRNFGLTFRMVTNRIHLFTALMNQPLAIDHARLLWLFETTNNVRYSGAGRRPI